MLDIVGAAFVPTWAVVARDPLRLIVGERIFGESAWGNSGENVSEEFEVDGFSGAVGA